MAKKIPTLKARAWFKRRLIIGMVLRPLRLFCDLCDKYVPSDLVWTCSYCGHENQWTKLYSFLYKCQKCKRAPKSYSCPHCDRLNFLVKERDETKPARFRKAVVESIEKPPLPEPPPDPHVTRQRAHDERKNELKEAIEVAKLKRDLAEVLNSPAFQKAKSEQERVHERFSTHDAHQMGVRMLEREKKATYEIEFKDDPDMLQMKLMSLEDFVQKEIQ